MPPAIASRELSDPTSPPGLLAETIDPATGSQSGTFPQVFSHAGLVDSADYLGYATGSEAPDPPPIGIRLDEPTGPDG